MANEMSLDDAREYFRQAGVNVGGKNLVNVAIAVNGPIVYLAALDVNDDIWLTDNTKVAWEKTPRVPFMQPVASIEHRNAGEEHPIHEFQGASAEAPCQVCDRTINAPWHHAATQDVVK